MPKVYMTYGDPPKRYCIGEAIRGSGAENLFEMKGGGFTSLVDAELEDGRKFIDSPEAQALREGFVAIPYEPSSVPSTAVPKVRYVPSRAPVSSERKTKVSHQAMRNMAIHAATNYASMQGWKGVSLKSTHKIAESEGVWTFIVALSDPAGSQMGVRVSVGAGVHEVSLEE